MRNCLLVKRSCVNNVMGFKYNIEVMGILCVLGECFNFVEVRLWGLVERLKVRMLVWVMIWSENFWCLLGKVFWVRFVYLGLVRV